MVAATVAAAVTQNHPIMQAMSHLHKAVGAGLLGHVAKGIQPYQLGPSILAQAAQGLHSEPPALLTEGVDVDLCGLVGGGMVIIKR